MNIRADIGSILVFIVYLLNTYKHLATSSFFQHVEGVLGYRTAAAAYSLQHCQQSTKIPKIISWDCGAGSFQICDGGDHMFGRPMGSLTAFKTLLAIQGREASKDASSNPATLGHCLQLRTTLEEQIGTAAGVSSGLVAEAAHHEVACVLCVRHVPSLYKGYEYKNKLISLPQLHVLLEETSRKNNKPLNTRTLSHDAHSMAARRAGLGRGGGGDRGRHVLLQDGSSRRPRGPGPQIERCMGCTRIRLQRT